jgi:hypothetical protein
MVIAASTNNEMLAILINKTAACISVIIVNRLTIQTLNPRRPKIKPANSQFLPSSKRDLQDSFLSIKAHIFQEI